MKLFKSLLLGSAAGLIAVSGASAADLGVKKPAPVEYVKVCSAHGAGFFYIPGSDVCMQISGRVRAEYLYATTYVRGDDASSFRGHGRINVDVRQTTQYGLLRAFVRLESYADTGRYNGTRIGSVGYNNTAGLVTPNNQADLLNKAFIQFFTGTAGFFTAGRSVSFFDFYAGNDNYGRLIGSDRDNVNLFAYTATFGGGFSAALSVEDAYARRLNATQGLRTATSANGDGSWSVNGNYGLTGSGGIGLPAGAPGTIAGAGGSQLAYAGQRLPDVIANVRVDQAWGSAQLSAALHQVTVGNAVLPGALGAVGRAGIDMQVLGVTSAYYPSTKYGWAVQGGVKINLPMIAAGDTLWLQAAYAKGALDFAGVTRATADTAQFGSTGGIGSRVDGYIDSTGALKLATSWSIVGSFLHNFTPSIQGALYGAYGRVDYSGTGADRLVTTGPYAGAKVGFVSYNAWQVGARVNWIPVHNFTIGTEVMYNKIDPKGSVVTSAETSTHIATGWRVRNSLDTVTARIRFQRDF